jgi:hypothetical protein
MTSPEIITFVPLVYTFMCDVAARLINPATDERMQVSCTTG